MAWPRMAGAQSVSSLLALSPPHSHHDALFWSLTGWQPPSGKAPSFLLCSRDSSQLLRPFPLFLTEKWPLLAARVTREDRSPYKGLP